jgi:hypothetical protein
MDDIDKIAFILWFADYGESDSVDYYIKKWENDWLPDKTAEHYGDCTNIPCACSRCIMDNFQLIAKRIYERLYKDG